MDNLGRTIAASVIMLLFVGSAAASTADLYFTSPERQTEIESYAQYELTIENTGTAEDVYMMSADQDQVQIAPQRVPEEDTLEPGQKATVNVWYDPKPNQEAGTYSFDIKATSRASGKTYSTEGRVKVIRDHDVTLETTSSQTVCLGNKAVYNVDVTNGGTQAENFELITRYGQLTQSEIALEPGETRSVKVVASSNSSTTENFNIIASSKTSYAQDIINVEFNAERCWASQVSIQPGNKETAAYTGTEYGVTVRNTGTKDDAFTLTSNVGDLEETNFEIESGQTASTTLEVTPEELGTQTLTVTAESHVSTRGSATLNVYNGMASTVAFEDSGTTVCETEQFTADATVTNTGEAKESFALTASRGNLSDSAVELDPGESEEVELELNSAEMAMGANNVTLTSTAATFNAPSSTSTLTAVKENCHDLEMNLVSYEKSAGENKAAIYQIALTNTGTRENTYNLSVQAPDWVTVTPESKTVPAGQTRYGYIYAGVPFEKRGEIQITAMAEGTEIEKNMSAMLIVDDGVMQKILSEEDNTPTGSFFSNVPGIEATQTVAGRITAALILGILITAAILYHEW
ncbi:hypothetical protein [Candidatus Nanohalococcus occultus]|uniref:hypothetical protein n=1 Tax=Candidatus Nanohalococcus occultus TaxID=2978047 RepID=UPI0039DFA1D2